ncbi:MAG: hypothetical protein JWO89_706, partial [Verrucomicrobiaceae bacterium]|nr:hypothetical protein [Verrucomicrobiaceae bacterium]
AGYLRRVMDGEQVCLTTDGQVQVRITPEPTERPLGPVADQISQARQLKAQLTAKYGDDDDWTARDYLESGRRA